VAAQLTDSEEDLHAITRGVLALVGADEDLLGDAADAALARAGIPPEARRLLIAALGPPAGRPTVAELRRSLEVAATGMRQAPAPRRAGIASIFEELHGRRVFRTALWYVGGSVALVEAANVFVPMLGGPLGIVRLLAILAVCGLPIALTLSWVFDVAPSANTRLAPWPRLALLTGVAAASLVAATMIWRSSTEDDTAGLAATPPRAADPAHIAVLGFNTVGGDADLAAFATQLQVRLIDGLGAAAMNVSTGRDRQLRVLSYAGVLPFTRGGVMVDSLREARQVGTVLDGSVERARGAVRVFVRLVDTQTGDQIYTTSAIHSGDLVTLLDAIADSVIQMVRQKLGPVVRDHMRLLETRIPAAFDNLIWATSVLEEFDPALDRADYETAEQVLNDADSLLAEAQRLDPRWIEPIVVRGRQAKRRVRLALARGDSSEVAPAIAKGIKHAERGLALNASDPRALELRGELLQYRLLNARPTTDAETEQIRDAAERDLRASLVGHHAPAGPLRMLSELAGSRGRMREALTYGERAYDQDPFMEQVEYTVFRLFEYSFALRQDDAAAHWCTEGGQRWEGAEFDDCRLALAAWSDAYPLNTDSAWAVVNAELGAYPEPFRPNLEPRLHAMMAAGLARNGLRDSARVILREARRRDASPGVLRAAAGVHGLLNEIDSVLTTLRTLLHDRPSERHALGTAIELRSVVSDPRVAALLEPRATADGRHR
jgi:TolB-like protein